LASSPQVFEVSTFYAFHCNLQVIHLAIPLSIFHKHVNILLAYTQCQSVHDIIFQVLKQNQTCINHTTSKNMSTKKSLLHKSLHLFFYQMVVIAIASSRLRNFLQIKWWVGIYFVICYYGIPPNLYWQIYFSI
jgi:hypothetical protein